MVSREDRISQISNIIHYVITFQPSSNCALHVRKKWHSVTFNSEGNNMDYGTEKCSTTWWFGMPYCIFSNAPNEGEYDNAKDISRLVNIWKLILQGSLYVKSMIVICISNYSVSHSVMKNDFWRRRCYDLCRALMWYWSILFYYVFLKGVNILLWRVALYAIANSNLVAISARDATLWK